METISRGEDGATITVQGPPRVRASELLRSGCARTYSYGGTSRWATDPSRANSYTALSRPTTALEYLQAAHAGYLAVGDIPLAVEKLGRWSTG